MAATPDRVPLPPPAELSATLLRLRADAIRVARRRLHTLHRPPPAVSRRRSAGPALLAAAGLGAAGLALAAALLLA